MQSQPYRGKGAVDPRPWRPDVCIYHANCADGFGGAWAVWCKWGNVVRYVPASYGVPIDDNLAGQRVLFVDFSLKRDAMDALARGQAPGFAPHSIVVLDHHKTAEAELQPWRIGRPGDVIDLGQQLSRINELLALNECENVPAIVAYFDMQSSGARMAWEFCHQTPRNDAPPAIIALIEDRDLWRFSFGDRTRHFSAALQTYPHDFATWSGLASRVDDVVAEGRAIYRGHRANIEKFIVMRHWMTIGGHPVPVVNVPYHYASDCADVLLALHPTAAFAAAYFMRGDGRAQFSLRSRDDRVDVSEVAKAYGGGGHRNAADFEVRAALAPVATAPAAAESETASGEAA